MNKCNQNDLWQTRGKIQSQIMWREPDVFKFKLIARFLLLIKFAIQAMLANLRIRSKTFFTWALCSSVFFQPTENVKNITYHMMEDRSKIAKTHLFGIRYEIERLQTGNSFKNNNWVSLLTSTRHFRSSRKNFKHSFGFSCLELNTKRTKNKAH